YSGSDRSYHTQPTEYSWSSSSQRKTLHGQHGVTAAHQTFFEDRQPTSSPKGSSASVETYASTEFDPEPYPEDELPDYEVPEYELAPSSREAMPATPQDFSQLFPSSRRLSIRHDDTTLDGNMNLRIDTQVVVNGRRRDMTLFHLRLHDLKTRDFSLRRYCRDSGREVCHTTRRAASSSSKAKRPSFHRSLSNALNNMRSKSDTKTPTVASLKRHDSGYGSMHSDEVEADDRPRSEGTDGKHEGKHEPNSIRLEFSNYAQLDVRRRALTGNKRYEFEYWGNEYAWKRIVRKNGSAKEVSYHLAKSGSNQPVAFIVPVPLTRDESSSEQGKGGWIPPCSMWIADQATVQAQKDVSDVVVASGLMALVDDTIRMRFHSKGSRPMLLPLPNGDFEVEYVGPKRLINEMFGKRDGHHSTSNSRPST
ncbi:hypothetical protein K431DRAFT_204628, partial [Polychaeton citri CBS 116435]